MARLWVLFPICIGLSLVIVGVEGLYKPGSVSFGIYDWGPRLVGPNDWVYCCFIPSGLLITGYFLVGMSALKDISMPNCCFHITLFSSCPRIINVSFRINYRPHFWIFISGDRNSRIFSAHVAWHYISYSFCRLFHAVK